jgi:hypothetical protein
MTLWYIRKQGCAAWHWMNCQHMRRFRKQGLLLTWEAGFHHIIRDRRPHGDLCNECKAIERRERRRA